MTHELRVLFHRRGETSTTRLAPAAGGVTPEAPFLFALSEDDYEDLRWYLEEYLDLPDHGSRVRATRVEEALRGWGRGLSEALFGGGEARVLLEELLAGPAPRLLTVATDDSDLLRLPWELIADAQGPLSRQGVTVRRQLERAGRTRLPPVEPPLRLLVVISRPDDLGFIDPRATTPAMLDALDALGDRVQVDFCRPPTLPQLEAMLTAARDRGEPYHVVHFEGHGMVVPEIGLGTLCFERANGATTDPVRADRLGSLLAGQGVTLVILEACRTSMTGKVPAFRSVAPRLVEAGVGSVLAMSYAVHVEATRVLLERLYRELVAGKSFGQALEAGRAALIAHPHRWLERGPHGRTVELEDWFLPTLYQQGEDPVLLPQEEGGRKLPPFSERGDRGGISSSPAPPPRLLPEREEPGAFPRPPLYRFHGRAAELYRLERELRRHRAVLLHAMGGMGKTALAREAAHWWRRTGLFPDGACFVSFEQGAGAERVISVLGTCLEGPDFARHAPEEQERRARRLFDERRVLMVWDNFESTLPAFQQGEMPPLYHDEERARLNELFWSWTESRKGQGRLLVTCRPSKAALPEARKVELSGLARPDALHLAARALEAHGVALDDPRLERHELEGLLTMLSDHPLSIELVAPHLKTMTPREIRDNFAELLERFCNEEAEEERNRSLLASLEFSLSRLGEAAKEALPWLGLFRGGVFEQVLLDVSEMDPERWGAARRELEATALVGVDSDVLFANRPYLRFHPTLAWWAAEQTPAGEEMRQRFVAAYMDLWQSMYRAFFGPNPRGGMEMMEREEANFKTAVGWALATGAFAEASALGDTFREYVQRAARLRERDAWTAWLAEEVARGGFSEAAAGRERDASWVLFTQGRPQESEARLRELLERLKAAEGFETGAEVAFTLTVLGRMLDHAGQAPRAIPVLEDAVRRWSELVEQAQARGKSDGGEKANLSMALGDLASALRRAGRLKEALATAKRGLALDRELGRARDLTAGLSQIAAILKDQNRLTEADACYAEALEAARCAGDRELEASTLQHKGILNNDQGRPQEAAEYYRNAFELSQQANNEASSMRTCNLLGVVEQKCGRLPEARCWYERSRQLAQKRGDREAVTIAAQNLGIVAQKEGEAARKRGDETAARQSFKTALACVEQSLEEWQEMGHQPYIAATHGQLARLHLLLGDLDAAEGHAHRAREIYERLGLKELHIVYYTLASIAQARGNEAAAAEWEDKRDALLADLQALAG